MEYAQLVPVHVTAGALGLLSGAAAVSFRKGSRPHRLAGKVFLLSMLIMSGTGAFVAYFEPDMASVVAGLLTFYAVTTGWMTVKRDENSIGLFEVMAFLVAVAVAALGISSGFEASASESGTKDGYPAAIYFVFGGIAALAAALDLRVILNRGISGAQRIARHLWRMVFGLLMATSSFFLGQEQVFPEPVRKMQFLVLPVIVVILLLFFWLIRVLFTNWYRDNWR